ncbi:MAG: phage tail tape measure protein [Pseudomonadota bacterium]
MAETDPDIAVRITADTSQFKAQVAEAQRLASGFGSALSNAFQGAVVKGNKLDGVFKTLITRLSKLALDAAFKPLEKGLADGFAGLLGGFGKGLGGALPKVTPFAKGGVFNTPQMFGSAGSLGVLGEAGPEAILPLSRDGSGRLGVRMQGERRAPSVTVNITARDADSFRRAESDVAAAVSRAVARGQRNL